MYDDSRGVGEPLSEPGIDKKGLVIRGFHFVWIDNVWNSTFFHRGMGEYLMMKEFPLFVNDSGDPKDYIQKYMTSVRLYILNIVVGQTMRINTLPGLSHSIISFHHCICIHISIPHYHVQHLLISCHNKYRVNTNFSRVCW